MIGHSLLLNQPGATVGNPNGRTVAGKPVGLGAVQHSAGVAGLNEFVAGPWWRWLMVVIDGDRIT